MTLKSGKVYSDIGAPNNTYGVDGDIYMQLDGLKTTYRKEGAVWVAVGSSLGAIPEIISGTGVPSSLLGADGQYYRNVENQDIYYKSGGIWSAIGNLQGLAFQALLIQHGIGKDLGTAPNLINSGTLNSYTTPGEFYFTNAVADSPFGYGLMKVWRENETYIYQLVQGAGEQGLATRYSINGGTTWTGWRYPANRDGDNTRTFKVANAVANDDAVALGQVQGLSIFSGSNHTVFTGTGNTFNLAANKTIRVILIGGGGGGGAGGGGGSGYGGTGGNGGDSLIYPSGNAANFIVKALGGLGGDGAYGAGSVGSNPDGREVEINNLYDVVILSYQKGLQGSLDTDSPEIKHPTLKKLSLTTSGQGKAGAYDGVASTGGSGSGGAFVEAIIVNRASTPLVLSIDCGVGGAGGVGLNQNGNTINGASGVDGVCVVIY